MDGSGVVSSSEVRRAFKGELVSVRFDLFAMSNVVGPDPAENPQ